MENESEVDDDESHHDSENINASGSSSGKSSGKRKSRSGIRFKSWSFRLTVKTDLGDLGEVSAQPWLGTWP